MDTEDKVKYTIVSEGEVPEDIIAEIKAGLGEENEVPLDVSDLTELTVSVEGREDPLKIVGFKSMLHDPSTGDITIRMIIAQMIENDNERETN